MKNQIEFKDRELKLMENRFRHAVTKMEQLREIILDNSKMKKLYFECIKQKEKLHKEITDCMKVRYLYEDRAELIKREMNNQLKKKECQIDKLHRDIGNISKTSVQNERLVKLLKDKLRAISEVKINETRQKYLHEKQKSAALQEKVLEKHNENVILKQEMVTVQNRLEKYQEENFEAELSKKQRENVTLREEIAILKIELEKFQKRALMNIS